MKLATLKDGTRDGQLVVVSQDLHTAAIADAIAPTMQRVIEDWPFYAPQLHALYLALNTGRARRAFGFDPTHCMAPLPRAYRFANFGASSGSERADLLLGALDDVLMNEAALGAAPHISFQASLAAIVSDVPSGMTPTRTVESVRLLMLAAVFTAASKPADAADGAPQSQQQWCSFSPVAVTPDEFGDDWPLGRDAHDADNRLDVQVNGRRLASAGQGHALSGSSDMFEAPGFPRQIAALARAQRITAGTIVLGGPATRHDDGLGFGDRIRIDVADAAGASVCGSIEQSIVPIE